MARKLDPNRYLPYPEIVEARADRRPYRVFDSRATENAASGAVDKRRRQMLVPLEGEGRATRRHELGHVRYSPLRPPKVDFDRRVHAAVEDARVNLALAGRGVALDLSEDDELHVAFLLARDQKERDDLAVWLRPIASIGTSVEPALAAMLARWPHGDGPRVVAEMQRIRARLERARIRCRGEAAPERSGREVARELALRLRAEGVLDARLQSSSHFELDCATCRIAREAEDGAPARRARGRERDEYVAPGRLRVTRAFLTRARGGDAAPRDWRAATEGSVLRYPHRFAIDRAIFRARARRARGTILIDTSGSMRLSRDGLDRLVASTRAGLRIAVYAGEGDQGELRVVADGGLRAPDSALGGLGRGNVVDLPALEWLARQPKPRIWISDGGVTGVGDVFSRELRNACERVRARAGIRRVDTLDEAAALLAGARAVRSEHRHR